ncbi:PREDICTED: serine--tRNA ligase, mitochondrial-like [Priapulus caudatus]|uniref:serine--tRNA ligase n=1 Tax=Priapulus caudatus TaxID=37621 RepID=A0ABM1E3W5_PRICU|nr:PREDICTED: serine--tRNA ligase, mitochondrial-like [Priapulus caudatus]XP_014666886.1 PREDICTED: serine--tRNA ligase, mitochondrial-like [Priapulus caudatus]XP_014666887.1 PREDICTED: serine--tRNA ligase, mitochondrial-like [Priapulus caudatus]
MANLCQISGMGNFSFIMNIRKLWNANCRMFVMDCSQKQCEKGLGPNNSTVNAQHTRGRSRSNQPLFTDTELLGSNSCAYGQHKPKHYVSLCNETYYDDEEVWACRKKNGVLLDPPDIDIEYLCEPSNLEEIERNIIARKGIGNITLLQQLYEEIQQLGEKMVKSLMTQDSRESTEKRMNELTEKFNKEALVIPNRTHPDVVLSEDAMPRIVETCGVKPTFAFQPKTLEQLAKDLDGLRMDNLGNLTGPRTYYLKNSFAEMESALTRFTVDHLKSKGYVLMSVPDLLHPQVIDACGMPVTGDRSQVYHIDKNRHGRDLALSGTAEMALAGYHANRSFPLYSLPRQLQAVSRCFRAEVSHSLNEKGLYRVHQFTKVEMFGVTAAEAGDESEKLLDEMLSIQKQLYKTLGLHFVVLDMPSHELGAAAYRKYDIEAWMPGRGCFGEVSSTSNCTDYQSRRLHVRYSVPSGEQVYVHTVNGTACAVPRMLIAIIETYQQEDGSVRIPEALQSYMRGQTVMAKPAKRVDMRWLKYRSQH